MIDYPDTITLVQTTVDKFGTESVLVQATVAAVIDQNTGWKHQGNQDAITSSMTVYVDPQDYFVSDNWNRLEGMLAIVNPFGAPTSEAWYRITGVTVSRDHQLGNEIDNVLLQMKKTRGIDVS